MRERVLNGDEPEWLRKHPRRDYLVALYRATPPWIRRRDFDEIAYWAKAASAVFGEEYVQDHIDPLNHSYVCGLNVPWNIQLVPRRVNAAKSNIWAPDQLSLF